MVSDKARLEGLRDEIYRVVEGLKEWVDDKKVAFFCPICGERKDLNREGLFQCENCERYFNRLEDCTVSPGGRVNYNGEALGYSVHSSGEYQGIGTPLATVNLSLHGVDSLDVKIKIEGLRAEVNKAIEGLKELVSND